jgi:hypothetical protein
MAKLKIGDHTVTVDDSFKSLSPDEQQRTVDEISKSLPSKVANTAKLDAPPSKGDFSLDNVVRSVANGMTFGAADRIAAAANTVLPLDEGSHFGDYSGNLKNQQERTNAYREKHPVLNTVGNVVGNVAALPLMPEAITGGAMTGPVLSRVAAGGKAGALAGGLQGAFDSPDMTDVKRTVGGTAVGAAGGAVLGGGVPILAKGLGAVGSTIADSMRGYDGISSPAGKSLIKALKQMAPGEIDHTVDRLGPDATLMDMSPAFLWKGAGVSGNSPEARNTIAQMLTTRNNGTSNRLLGDVSANFGPAEAPRVLDKNIKNELKRADYQNYRVGAGLEAGNPELPQVDTQSLLDHLDKALPYAEGGEKRALATLKERLMMENPERGNASVEYAKADDYMPPDSGTASNGAREFARKMGGIKDVGGDLKSREVNKEMIGLLNAKGRDADKVREAMAQAGYFDHIYGSPEEAVIHSTPNDLKAAIEENWTPSGAQEDEWLRASTEAQGGRAEMRRQAQQMANEANERLKAGLPPQRIPKTNPVNLHKIKGELDNLIENNLPGLGMQASDVATQQGALKRVRGMLNDILENQVSGYRQANRESSKIRGRADALKQGYELFGGKPGETPMWPTELEALRKGLGSANVDFRNGARSKIEEKFRHTANDLTAGKSITGGENDFRRELLSQVFGEDETRNVLKAVEREKQFADTHNKINQNSVTQPKQQATKEEAPASIGTLAGIKDAIISPILERFAESMPRSAEYYPEMAKILTAQGAERDQYIKALAKGLNRKVARSEKMDKLGSKASLAAALLTADGARTAVLPVIDVPGRQ